MRHLYSEEEIFDQATTKISKEVLGKDESTGDYSVPTTQAAFDVTRDDFGLPFMAKEVTILHSGNFRFGVIEHKGTFYASEYGTGSGREVFDARSMQELKDKIQSSFGPVTESVGIDEARSLIKVNVLWDGGTGWTMTYRGGHKVFRGSAEGFRKFLQKLKASDVGTDPASVRNVKYMDMVQEIQNKKYAAIWVWSNILMGLSGSVFSEEKVMETIKLEESVRLPNTSVVLEEGEIIDLIEQRDISNGEYYNVDMGEIKRARRATPQWIKLVRNTVKKGEGKVYVVDVRGDDALVAASPMDALLGPITVPLDALF